MSPPSFWDGHPPERRLSTPLDLAEVRTRLETLFTRMGYRWTEAPSPPISGAVATRRAMVLWARPLGSGALLLALVGLAIAAGWGWQGEEWQPLPGESRAVAHGTPYVVRLDAFDLQVDDGQRLQNYASQITWLEDESEVQQETIDIGRASSRRGATVRQVGFAPVVRLRGWDQDGRLLALETAEEALSLMGEVEIRFASAEARPLVSVPAQDLSLALTFEPVCAQGRPALYVELVQGDSSAPGPEKVLYGSESVVFDGLRFDVELLFVPILRADHRPAMGLAVGGLVLYLISLVILWMVPPRLASVSWAPAEDERTGIRVQTLRDALNDRQLVRLAHRLEEALSSHD